jgi:hypothetical protein
MLIFSFLILTEKKKIVYVVYYALRVGLRERKRLRIRFTLHYRSTNWWLGGRGV